MPALELRDKAGENISVAPTRDGQRLVKWTKRKKDWQIEILDVRTGKLLLPPFKTEHEFVKGSVGPDGRQAAFLRIERLNKSARFWLHLYNLETGKPVWPPVLIVETETPDQDAFLHLFKDTFNVWFSPDGKLLLTQVATLEHIQVCVFATLTGKPLTAPLQTDFQVATDSEQPFSSEGDYFYMLEDLVGLRAYDSMTGRPDDLGTPIRLSGMIDKVVHGPGDISTATLVTIGGNTTLSKRVGVGGEVIGLWSPKGTPRFPLLRLPRGIRQLTFRPDGAQMLAVADSGQAWVWDITRPARTPHCWPARGMTEDLRFSDDGRLLVVGLSARDKEKEWNAYVQVFNIATGKAVSPMIRTKSPDPSADCYLTGKAALSPDGRLLATLCPNEPGQDLDCHQIRVWETATGKPVGPPIVARDKPKNWPSELWFSPDGR
jgi:WD40 repeat protein